MFRVFGAHGRTPKCENCKNKNSEVGIDGDSDMTKWKLCGTCFDALINAINAYVGT